mgnify:CR=1 FL=1
MTLKSFVSLTTAAALALMMAAGCTLPGGSSSLPSTKVMDFNAPLTLKKPAEPIKESPEVLFLGNSFTFYNDLPQIFLELSYEGGFSPEVYDYTEGYYQLQMFADPQDELGAEVYDVLENYSWDYVILQDHSIFPAIEPESLTYPAARTLDKMVKDAGGRSVFFMTWAYRGGYDLSEMGLDVQATREEMQTQLSQSYTAIADELDALLCPAGIAFMRSIEKYPDIDLWNEEDGQHPSEAGSYLAACCMYATIYNESPVGLTYLTENLDADTASKLQQIAAETVLNTD